MQIDPTTLTGAPNATIRGAGGGPMSELRPRGQLTGAYTTLDTLGQGGAAMVRRARQLVLDREVAIKTPLRERLGPAGVQRVLQEAWVTGSLEHPGVVPVHDLVVDEEGCPHIVMRRIAGHTWTELLRAPATVAAQFGVRDVMAWHLRVLMSVAGTVHHAHQRGVLHRDLKPDNVMIGAAGEVYLLDWGLAVALDEETGRHLPLAVSQTTLAGTPHYMAPEMARADGAAFGVATDVYLLGGLLFTVLTGRPPHDGDDVQAVVDAAAAEVPVVPPGVPGRLRALCDAALAMDPADRPASAESFRRSVQAWLEERDADALAEAGVAALTQLRELIEAGNATAVPGAFAAVRAPCDQALARAPHHPAALAARDRAFLHMVDFELQNGTARAAASLLAEVRQPPPGVAERIEAVARAQAQRAAAAATLLAEFDVKAGERTRAFVSLLLGLLFVFVPLLTGRFARDAPMGDLALGTGGVLAAVLGLWVWARDSLGRSVLNRAVIRTTAAVPAMHLLLMAGAAPLGLDAVEVTVLLSLLAALTCLTMAAALEPFMLLPALGYVATFLGAANWPALRWEWAALGNAMLATVALWRWGPSGLVSWLKFRAEKERARRR